MLYLYQMSTKEIKKKKRKEIKKKLLHKYRLVVLNEGTYEEKISFKLSRLNVFVVGCVCTLFLIAITTVMIAFTPMREYIPGYASTKLKRQATALTYKTDSLVNVLNYTNEYITNVRRVLRGEISSSDFSKDSINHQIKLDPSTVNLTPIKADSLLRRKVTLEDKYNLFETNTNTAGVSFYSPLKGTISQGYDNSVKHFAIDIVAPKDTPVKAVADGTVIFAEWTTETGYVILLEHKEGILSVYKHNGALVKSQGDLVKAGEVIAVVGNTGELTTGPHLHFELWTNGYPVNPLNYIEF